MTKILFKPLLPLFIIMFCFGSFIGCSEKAKETVEEKQKELQTVENKWNDMNWNDGNWE